MPLSFFFGVPSKSDGAGRLRHTLHLLDVDRSGSPSKVRTSDAKELQSLFEREQPDIVIYDTLIQLHAINENDNVAMRSLMETIRSITAHGSASGKTVPITHVIVHHTRKEDPSRPGAFSPDSMRGAGSVHGAADAVILVRHAKDAQEKGGTLEVHVSSRGSSVNNFFLTRNPKNLTFEIAGKPKRTPVAETKEMVYQTVIMEHLAAHWERGATIDTPEFRAAVERYLEKHQDIPKFAISGDYTIDKCVAALIERGRVRYVDGGEHKNGRWKKSPIVAHDPADPIVSAEAWLMEQENMTDSPLPADAVSLKVSSSEDEHDFPDLKSSAAGKIEAGEAKPKEKSGEVDPSSRLPGSADGNEQRPLPKMRPLKIPLRSSKAGERQDR